VTSILAVFLCLYAAASSVITSISTITLYLAYIIPIFLNWRNRRRALRPDSARPKQSFPFVTPEMAPWNLGRWGAPINLVAICYTAFIVFIFAIPPNELVLWTMLAVLLGLFLYWQLYAKRSFAGPKIGGAAAAR
jgi:hypothetical protein